MKRIKHWLFGHDPLALWEEDVFSTIRCSCGAVRTRTDWG